jgi:hypothetical protein
LEFKSYIIKTNEDKTTNNTWYIVAIGLIAVLHLPPLDVQHFDIYICGGCHNYFCCCLCEKRKYSALQISKEQIVLTPASVRIDQKTYKISEISEIVFIVHSFNGMNLFAGR